MSERKNYRAAMEALIADLQKMGCDVSLRSAYSLWGLSNGDGSRDLSVLYSARDMVIYLAGYRKALLERHPKKESTHNADY